MGLCLPRRRGEHPAPRPPAHPTVPNINLAFWGISLFMGASVVRLHPSLLDWTNTWRERPKDVGCTTRNPYTARLGTVSAPNLHKLPHSRYFLRPLCQQRDVAAVGPAGFLQLVAPRSIKADAKSCCMRRLPSSKMS